MATCVIHDPTPMPDPSALARLRALSTSVISDSFGRWAGAPGILPVSEPHPPVVVGPACTVRTLPGDNLVVHKALDVARAGEIVVVAGQGATDRALVGALMGSYATSRGVAALVVDGAVRDVAELADCSPPTFARAVCHLGPFKVGSGEIRGTVSIGGLTISDGDIVIGDADGVAVVPRDRLDEVLAAAEAKEASEQAEFAAIAEGRWDRTWVDEALGLS